MIYKGVPKNLYLNKDDPSASVYKNKKLAVEDLKIKLGNGPHAVPNSHQPKTSERTFEKSANKPFDIIANMKLYELFDNQFFVENLKKFRTINEKYEYIDNMLYLRTENKVFKFEYGLKRLEP